MNTSTKILIGFFLIVFLVPVMVVMALKSKIRKDEFKMISRESFENGNSRTGTPGVAKVVRLVGIPGNALNVNVSSADKPFYRYGIGTSDSVRIHSQADTLTIVYTFTGKEPGNANLYLDLQMPNIEQIIAENAEVNIVSLDSLTQENLVVQLNGTSRLNMGENEDEFGRYRDMKPVTLHQFTVNMDQAAMYLGKGVHIREMNIDALGKSTLHINKEVVIDKINGKLSDSTLVKAAWNYLKQLNNMPAQ